MSSADPDPPPRHRPRGLTPEQRRLLGTARSLADETERSEPPPSRPPPAAARHVEEAHEPTAVEATPARTRSSSLVKEQEKAGRAIELRHAFIALALLLVVVLTFFAGRRFDYLNYSIMTRLNAKELAGSDDKFPGLTAEQLINEALLAEKRGDWAEAAERLLAAKRKDSSIPGILFHIGKGCYDRGDLAGADLSLSHALRFGENVPAANYYRGLVAVRRHDVPAAIRFFETAASAEPFNGDLFYFWGEALRLDFKPREAIKRYEQAIMRKSNATDMTLCSFKIRLAMIEDAQANKVRAELEKVREAGALSSDWLVTEAALQMQAGEFAAAARLIQEARELGPLGLWAACVGDTSFVRAGQVNPEIGAVVLEPAPSPPPPASDSVPP